MQMRRRMQRSGCGGARGLLRAAWVGGALGITLVLCTGQPGQAQRRARGSGGKKAPPAAETPREPHVEGAADASGLEGAQDAAQGAAPTSAATPPGTGAAHGLPSEGGAPSAKPAAEASPATVPEEPAPEGAAPAALSKDTRQLQPGGGTHDGPFNTPIGNLES
jgi:hypothetical protein